MWAHLKWKVQEHAVMPKGLTVWPQNEPNGCRQPPGLCMRLGLIAYVLRSTLIGPAQVLCSSPNQSLRPRGLHLINSQLAWSQGTVSWRKRDGCWVVRKATNLCCAYIHRRMTAWVPTKMSTGSSPTSRTWGRVRHLFF